MEQSQNKIVINTENDMEIELNDVIIQVKNKKKEIQEFENEASQELLLEG